VEIHRLSELGWTRHSQRSREVSASEQCSPETSVRAGSADARAILVSVDWNHSVAQ